MVQKALRGSAWLVLLVLAFFTLSPIALRPHTGFPANDERLAAFLVAGLLFALAYPKRIWWVAAILLVSAFGLEWMQNLRLDRHGQVDDAFVKAFGACVGLGLGWFVRNGLRLVRRSNSR